MKITKAQTTCGQMLKIGTRIQATINGDILTGTITAMKMSEYRSTLAVTLDSGEAIYLPPQWSVENRTQVRLSDIGLSVCVLSGVPEQAVLI